MSMNMGQFNAEGKEVIYTSKRIVSEYQQQEIEPEHILLAILEQKNTGSMMRSKNSLNPNFQLTKIISEVTILQENVKI